MAANRSSVVLGLVGVSTSSLPSSLGKSRVSEEEAAVLGSSKPAREKKGRHTLHAVTSPLPGSERRHFAAISDSVRTMGKPRGSGI